MINWFKNLDRPVQAGLAAFGFIITVGIVGAVFGAGVSLCLFAAGIIGVGVYAGVKFG